mgnify:CR=1 FL=1
MPPTLPPLALLNPRVLVIDDQADAADSLDLLLTQLGCDTSVAYGALEGLQQATQFLPDVVMLDLHMPRIDGLDAARALRACRLPSRPLLVAMTADTRPGLRAEALAAGFDMHLVKPTPPAEIVAALRDLLTAAGAKNRFAVNEAGDGLAARHTGTGVDGVAGRHPDAV